MPSISHTKRKEKKKRRRERIDKSSMHPKHLLNIGTVVEKMGLSSRNFE
jgi:hypothetical protein